VQEQENRKILFDKRLAKIKHPGAGRNRLGMVAMCYSASLPVVAEGYCLWRPIGRPNSLQAGGATHYAKEERAASAMPTALLMFLYSCRRYKKPSRKSTQLQTNCTQAKNPKKNRAGYGHGLNLHTGYDGMCPQSSGIDSRIENINMDRSASCRAHSQEGNIMSVLSPTGLVVAFSSRPPRIPHRRRRQLLFNPINSIPLAIIACIQVNVILECRIKTGDINRRCTALRPDEPITQQIVTGICVSPNISR